MAILAISLARPAHAAPAPGPAAAPAPPPAPANSREQRLIQARAADAIGEVLMAASEQAEEQVRLFRRKLGVGAEEKSQSIQQPATHAPVKAPEIANAPANAQAQAGPAPARVDAAAPRPEVRSAFQEMTDQVVAAVRRGGGQEPDEGHGGRGEHGPAAEIGRASCRERG